MISCDMREYPQSSSIPVLQLSYHTSGNKLEVAYQDDQLCIPTTQTRKYWCLVWVILHTHRNHCSVGLLDWSTRLVYWVGLLDWSIGLVYSVSLLDWSIGLVYWSGLLYITSIWRTNFTSLSYIIILRGWVSLRTFVKW